MRRDAETRPCPHGPLALLAFALLSSCVTGSPAAAPETIADVGASDAPVDVAETSGDTDFGLPSATCSQPEECVQCSLAAVPLNQSDCACIGCDTFPTTSEVCELRMSARSVVCAVWMPPKPCQAVSCEDPPKAVCNVATHSCITAPSLDLSCSGTEACVACKFPFSPITAAECYCPSCPVLALSTDHCASHAAAWSNVCSSAGLSCKELTCDVPKPASCGSEDECVFN